MGRIRENDKKKSKSYWRKYRREYMRKYRSMGKLRKDSARYIVKGVCPICGGLLNSTEHILNGQECSIKTMYLLRGLVSKIDNYYIYSVSLKNRKK